MKTLKLFILATIIILSTGCEPEVAELDMPENPIQLAVFGFISPTDSITKIYVSGSVSVLGKHQSPKEIHNATITITHNNKTYNLPYNPNYDAYTITSNELKIIGGETYTLTASASGYPTATSTIKTIAEENKSLKAIQNYPYIKHDDKDNNYVTLQLTWQDNANQENYYALHIQQSEITSTTYTQPYKNTFFKIFEDTYFNGEEKTFKERTHISYNTDTAIFNILLLNTDKHYYLYHKNQKNNNWNSDDNPFVEPTPIYTNINNGIGVFCSYTKYGITEKFTKKE